VKSQKTYLEQILERIKRIDSFAAQGENEFLESVQIQDAILRNFEIIGEIVKRIDPKLKDKQPTIGWKKIAGLRDVLIHNYDEINLQLIWETIQVHLPPLKLAIQTLLEEFEA
jgi:uncharacterized protein with HEPN domain